MKYEAVCKKCGRKFEPIFENHIFNGNEQILHGNELVMNGSEYINNGKNVQIRNYSCPYCGEKYRNGIAKLKGDK